MLVHKMIFILNTIGALKYIAEVPLKKTYI